MKGYVKYLGVVPMYALKRVFNSGETLEFNELVKLFGKNADVSSDENFVKWLLENKFVDSALWKVVPYKEKIIAEEMQDIVGDKLDKTMDTAKIDKISEEKVLPTKKIEEEKIDKVVEFVKTAEAVEKEKRMAKTTAVNKEIIKTNINRVNTEVTADTITSFKTNEVKKGLSKIKDVKLLKRALKKAEGMSRKAMLCNALRDRITELGQR